MTRQDLQDELKTLNTSMQRKLSEISTYGEMIKKEMSAMQEELRELKKELLQK